MVSHRENEIVIVGNLQNYLSTEQRPCNVVRQNQVAKTPPYPYVAYSVTTALVAHNGTYCKAEDGTLYRDAQQVWSFTVQSDDHEEAMALGMKLYDFFTAVGIVPLADKNITVRRVTNLTTRDNLISIEYEYRTGLDVTFGLLYVIEPIDNGFIETVEINKNELFVLGKSKLGFGVLG